MTTVRRSGDALPFHRCLIGQEEIDEVVDTLRSGWLTTGPKTARFTEEFRTAVGAPAALAVSSCTAALHLALVVAGIGPGDVVFTTPFTFASTLHVIEHVGAKPVLVDVEHDTLNLDPARLEEAVQSCRDGQPRAVIPVHLAGHPCAMDQVLVVAERAGLVIVEDAAHALPARYRGRLVGTPAPSAITQLAAFSFYATKNLATGEGGMLTGPVDLVEEAAVWSLHGMSRDAWKRYARPGAWRYDVTHPGFKYNMTDLQAALGLHQLAKLPAFQARRESIVARYDAAFADVPELELPARRAEVTSALHLYILRLHLDAVRISRDVFIDELASMGIGTSVHFIPITHHRYFRDRYGWTPSTCPVAACQYQRCMSLPLYPRMTDRDVEDVVDCVRDVVARHRR